MFFCCFLEISVKSFLIFCFKCVSTVLMLATTCTTLWLTKSIRWLRLLSNQTCKGWTVTRSVRLMQTGVKWYVLWNWHRDVKSWLHPNVFVVNRCNQSTSQSFSATQPTSLAWPSIEQQPTGLPAYPATISLTETVTAFNFCFAAACPHTCHMLQATFNCRLSNA